MMKKTLLSSLLLASTIVNAGPWMPWDNNSYNNNDSFMDSWNPFASGNTNWNPLDAGSNWGPFSSGSNFGPFDSASKFNPLDASSDFGPFNADQNWGPLSNMNDMVNESDWGFYYENKNKVSNKGYARADGKYAEQLSARGVGYADGYTKGNADAYYKGQLDGYGKARGTGRFEGYGEKGYLGYTPTTGNGFPAPSN